MSGQARTGKGGSNVRPSAQLPRARSVDASALGFERLAPICDGMASLSACGNSATQDIVVTNCASHSAVNCHSAIAVPRGPSAESVVNQGFSVNAIVGTLCAYGMVPDSGVTGDKTVTDRLPRNLVTPHIEVTRGPAGWSTTIRGAGGIVLAWGFAAPAEPYVLPDEVYARALSTRNAMQQLA